MEIWICKINGYLMQTNCMKIDVCYLLFFSQEPNQSKWRQPILQVWKLSEVMWLAHAWLMSGGGIWVKPELLFLYLSDWIVFKRRVRKIEDIWRTERAEKGMQARNKYLLRAYYVPFTTVGVFTSLDILDCVNFPSLVSQIITNVVV